MQASYSTILFDFDGTLTSSLELWLQAYRYGLAKFDLDVTDEVIVARCFYRDFDLVAKEFNLSCAIQFEKMVKEGLDIVFEEAKVFSGVKEVLTNCANHNIELAVVTSSPRATVEKALQTLDIASFFSVVVTADDVENFKPHPEPVLLALKKLGAKKDCVLMIGDSQADMLAGQAAGIKTGLFYPEAHSQFYDFQELLETEPHFVFHHYDELEKHLFIANE